MNLSITEEFRNLVNQINLLSINEGEEETTTPTTPTKPVDSLLTKPAGLEKVAGSLDSASLVKMLDIPQNQVNDFNTAITALRDDAPQLTNKQALALATAFDHLLRASGQGKTDILNKMRTVGAPTVTEDEGEETSPATIEDVVKIIHDSSEVSPVAKLQATKLVKKLTQGITEKKRHGGVSHILSGVSDALTAAGNGDETTALRSISSMVNKVEGDEMAFDQTQFPQIVVTLMLLVGDILQHAEK
jgi:hypothetical protein